MGVVIEGIETEQQRVLAKLAGCNEMQGDLFARPALPEEIERLLAEGDIRVGGRAAAAALGDLGQRPSSMT